MNALLWMDWWAKTFKWKGHIHYIAFNIEELKKFESGLRESNHLLLRTRMSCFAEEVKSTSNYKRTDRICWFKSFNQHRMFDEMRTFILQKNIGKLRFGTLSIKMSKELRSKIHSESLLNVGSTKMLWFCCRHTINSGEQKKKSWTSLWL